MKTLKPIPYPKGYEKQFASLMVAMTEAMSTQFKNQTLEKLNKGTIEKFDGTKFEDAQSGNYSAAFIKLANSAKTKLKKRFSNKRIKKEVERILRSLNAFNQKAFYTETEKFTGVSVQQAIAQEGLTADNNALILETVEWVKQLRDDNLSYFANNSLMAMTNGASFAEVMESYTEESKKRKNHSEFIARNQLSSFNGLNNKIRAQKLGITKAVWVASRDERVRSSHAARDGKEFDLSKGLYSSTDGKTLLPGIDYQCRCISRMVLPD